MSVQCLKHYFLEKKKRGYIFSENVRMENFIKLTLIFLLKNASIRITS